MVTYQIVMTYPEVMDIVGMGKIELEHVVPIEEFMNVTEALAHLAFLQLTQPECSFKLVVAHGRE